MLFASIVAAQLSTWMEKKWKIISIQNSKKNYREKKILIWKLKHKEKTEFDKFKEIFFLRSNRGHS